MCLISAMGPGGAERVMSRLVNHLSERHDVLLLTWERPGATPAYPIRPTVAVVNADRIGGRGLLRLWRIVTRPAILRRQITAFRPDVVLSFIDTMNITTLVGAGADVPVVVSERIDPGEHPVNTIIDVARRVLYPRASRVVVQTARAAAHIPLAVGNRVSIVANPIAPAISIAQPRSAAESGRFRIIGLGRLEVQKGFDRLIDAFAAIADKNPLWDLVIFGEGTQRAALERQVASLHLGSRILLPGATTTPEHQLAASHIAGFSSRYEGFPNALGEALAAGLPSVGFKDVSGVEDLIVDGVTGYLVESSSGIDGLSLALERLMTDGLLRERLGAAARAHSARWAPDVVLSQWEALLIGEAKQRPSEQAAQTSLSS
jgi:glycosyltransferase involved in cell wall biosynthesis